MIYILAKKNLQNTEEKTKAKVPVFREAETETGIPTLTIQTTHIKQTSTRRHWLRTWKQE